MTHDFFEDATDTLAIDQSLNFFLLTAREGSPNTDFSWRMHNKQQVQFVRRRINAALDQIEAQLPSLPTE